MNQALNNGMIDQLAALWATIKHYRGRIYIGTVFFSLAGATLVFMMPDHYKASTTILVDPQKIPEKYVSPTISSDPGQRLTTITQQVLSSTRLQQIIDTMHLYPELQGKSSREEIIDKMRKDITITADCALTAPMFMFWTGSSPTKIQNEHFYAYTRQRLMF